MNIDTLKSEIEKICEGVGIIVPTDKNGEFHMQEEMDSLQFVSLICDLEERYNIEFMEEELIPDSYDSYNIFVTAVIKKIMNNA